MNDTNEKLKYLILSAVVIILLLPVAYRVTTKCEKSSFKLFKLIDVALGGCSTDIDGFKEDNNTVTLRNGQNAHDFVFSSEVTRDNIIKVKINIVGIYYDSCSIDTKKSDKCDKRINIDVRPTSQRYIVNGDFRLDEKQGVIRFSGNLILENLAHITYNDGAILAASYRHN